MNITKVKMGLATTLVLMSSVAFAGYVEEEPMVVKSSEIKYTQSDRDSDDLFNDRFSHGHSAITQVGVAPKKLTFVKGYAKDVALITALKQILPQGWHAKKAGVLDVNQTVSWKGGKSWVAILGDLTKGNNFGANIDWEKRIVTVMGDVTTGANKNNDVNIKVVSAAPQKTWSLVAGKTLRENIEMWAATAGWTVSWDAVDYAIPANIRFVGELDDDAGPLAKLAEAYKTSDQPILINASSIDKVIRVENLEKRQKVVRN